MLSRKQTAWRKSRTFGDLHGGRVCRHFADNLFARAHSLKCPAPDVERPIYLVDNPSRDFFFPVSVADVRATLEQLPPMCRNGLTHVWLRRVRKSDYEALTKPFASFIAGSGVRLIVLYAWPKDLLLPMGEKKPSQRKQRLYAPWGPELIHRDKEWYFRWTQEGLRLFYLQHLLLHEVGHHVDLLFRRWSRADSKRAEEFADQYAIEWSHAATTVHDPSAEEGEVS
jgi:hypothetical protein